MYITVFNGFSRWGRKYTSIYGASRKALTMNNRKIGASPMTKVGAHGDEKSSIFSGFSVIRKRMRKFCIRFYPVET